MNRIKELRQERNLTQTQLAKMCGISQSALSGYESGKFNPDSRTLHLLSNIFDVTVDYIIAKDEPEEKNNNVSPLTFALQGEIHDFTAEEINELMEFARFVKSKRNKK